MILDNVLRQNHNFHINNLSTIENPIIYESKKSCLQIINYKEWRNQTPGLALQSIPCDNDLEDNESIPRQEVSRAEETAE